jgi:hypothetical protein
MSQFYVLTHPSPQGAYAGWSYCAITDCECLLPKVCTRSDDHCARRKVCARSECECDRLRVCESPFCECGRPKVITDSYGNPLRSLHSGLVESYSVEQEV